MAKKKSITCMCGNPAIKTPTVPTDHLHACTECNLCDDLFKCGVDWCGLVGSQNRSYLTHMAACHAFQNVYKSGQYLSPFVVKDPRIIANFIATPALWEQAKCKCGELAGNCVEWFRHDHLEPSDMGYRCTLCNGKFLTPRHKCKLIQYDVRCPFGCSLPF